ncbi:MAG: GNAT family N-acetyltransferase [Nitrospirota bacterium]
MRNDDHATIRPARPGDIPRMSDLLTELFGIEADFTPDVEKQVRALSVLVAAPPERVCVLVAEQKGVIAGMATVQTLISTAEGGRVGLVEDVVVHRDYRGRGIGALLIETIADWARSHGLTRLQLLADRDNQNALDFYASQDWSVTRLICLRSRP